jgi:hypothetical protein
MGSIRILKPRTQEVADVLEGRDDRVGRTRQVPVGVGLRRSAGAQRLGSFDEAFEDALRVAAALRPLAIRVRWHPAEDSYTWSIEY